ncbi:Cof-type HAD-IIB family hydrolase [Desertibacillus haloalkaliphilus]|uniref:Cof-type HAD-IIB family hydrolase n=1 Tax=Desertibacillus haloalkaliphilus TaxID=1328930 RepID=UPI001C267058|nr:Cof-type HAD-IIB family hydrolase [Desertibacillus haloalkaliphilus]MBU8906759.1 Cof-type HAD-IIB family hydrolase [Desertibacillus haloalkaliphilus]
MAEKMVFFDIDGTLVDDHKEVPASTKEAIINLKQAGVHVAIATGRAPFMFRELRSELGIDSYISFNGSYVVYEGEVIYKQPLDKDHLYRLEGQASENEHPMVFLNHEVARANAEGHTHIDECMTGLKLPYPPYDHTFYHNEEIYQALIFCERQQEHTYVGGPHLFDFVRWHQFSIDVLPKGGSKAKGIEQLLRKNSIKVENTYAFGDALNDLEMLELVGTGVAMGNGLDEVKKVANVVTSDVSGDGIFNGLKKVGLL